MGYCTVLNVDMLMPQAMSSARPDATGNKINLINIPAANPTNPVGVNRIPNSIVEQYISLADSDINGIFSHMYRTPFRKCSTGEWELAADISEYNQILQFTEVHSLNPSDEIILRDDNTGNEERHIVQEAIDEFSILTINPIANVFIKESSRVFRISYPEPINQISARFAVSYIYDKYFAAQNDPNISQFGEKMRSIANGQINDILNGRVNLWCQLRVGDRFGNPYIDSTYAVRALPQDFDTNSRDRSIPTK